MSGVRDLATAVADRLVGQCLRGVEDVLDGMDVSPAQRTPALYSAVDELAFCCGTCDWWCEASEMEGDWTCADCAEHGDGR